MAVTCGIVSVVVALAMLTGGCLATRTTPTSTGVWIAVSIRTMAVDGRHGAGRVLGGRDDPSRRISFRCWLRADGWLPAQVMSGWHAEREAVRVDLPGPLYAEAQRICGAT